jgi:MFS family permease
MTTALGVVGSAPLDWTHAQVLPVFSAAAVTLGVTTSTLGAWVEREGPRKAGMIGSFIWSSALLTTAAGVHFHSLPLVYCGYGLLGGVGWGLMYLAPVTTVMKWFPDKRGLATGIALSAFGVGAAMAPAMIQLTMDAFAIAPDFVGTLSDVSLTTLADGSQVVADWSASGVPGQAVLVATDTDLAKHSSFVTTGPGVYALGSGDSGTAKAFGALGVFYGGLGALGSRFMSVPHPDWAPTTTRIDQAVDDGKTAPTQSSNDVGLPVDYVTGSTRQFPLLWLTIFGNATGGLALLSSSKLMLIDIWQGVAPEIVTTSFATGYVASLGIGMAVGRFGWSALSDYLGRQNTYLLFGLGIPIMGSAPYLCHAAASATDASTLPLYLYTFYGGSVLAITFYGGIFSVLPAYIADLFGQKYSGAIHGKALTAWASSAVAGPMGLAYLRGQAVETSTQDLLGKVEDPSAFAQAFGCSVTDTDMIQTLVRAKTITIGRLMEFVPDGTVDPTPFLYDSTCYAAASLMGVSVLANLAIRPLNVQQRVSELEEAKLKKAATEATSENDEVMHTPFTKEGTSTR